jgi:glycerol-3-phosphate dehydrogenase
MTKGRLETQVLIIGGGLTGAGLARDLALRGVACLVVERADLNAGASGANHGLLHSGARYVSNDPVAAQECREESELLKRLSPDCIEETGGLFVALAGDRESYIADFPGLCRQNGLPVTEIDCDEAKALEPELSSDIIAAYRVEDATVDPFKLSFDNLAEAETHGATVLTGTEVVKIERNRSRIRAVVLRTCKDGREFTVKAEQVANATGAWAGKIAALAGAEIPMAWSKGTLLVTHRRLNQRVINRLRPPGDGDIVVPGGTVSVVGTTSVRIDDLNHVFPSFEEVDFLVDETAKMLPVLKKARYVRAFAGVRPLPRQESCDDDRSVSRGFLILDHEADGLSNFVTVTGGKLTTFRLMAEKTADILCRRLGVETPCLTREQPIVDHESTKWVLAGIAPHFWRHGSVKEEAIICECEMVPFSVVKNLEDDLHRHGQPVTIDAIRMRSRLGKGACQGAFCGLRTAAYLYDSDEVRGEEGLSQLRAFLERRWHGLRPVLWGTQLAQETLQEAIHCGLLGLEL